MFYVSASDDSLGTVGTTENNKRNTFWGRSIRNPDLSSAHVILKYLSQPTQVFLPGESHGQRSLAGYSPWGRKNRT